MMSSRYWSSTTTGDGRTASIVSSTTPVDRRISLPGSWLSGGKPQVETSGHSSTNDDGSEQPGRSAAAQNNRPTILLVISTDCTVNKTLEKREDGRPISARNGPS